MKQFFIDITKPVAVFLAILALATGATTALLLVNTAPPSSIADGEDPESVQVTAQETYDRKSVELNVNGQGERTLLAGKSGILTRYECVPGEKIASGSSVLSINGKDLINIHTETPPYENVVFEGRTIEFENVIWLPEPEMVINSCPLSLGQNVGFEQVLYTVPSQVTGAKIAEFPENMIAGDRVLRISEEEFHLNKDGAVSQKDLLKLAATQQYRQQVMGLVSTGSESVKITADYSLVNPVNISVVPPSAIVTETETKTCVISDGKPIAVNIIGSELGRTFVEFAGNAPESVTFRPEKDATCGE
ncbi:MAG: hypothetical protein LBL41_04255 [Bifidobacteriaceae bacterium]|jgi:hypothetical protein|nr:hypothetical protein [Bifidobacteriaceae bacterium]